MSGAKEGDTVRVQFTVRLDDGTVYDSSDISGPMVFKIGEGNFLPKVEQSVIGMRHGESKTIRIPMEEAYGPRIEERVFEFDRKKAPEGFDPVLGQQVQMYRADGKPVSVTVVGVSETTFIMDCNHPLAGKDLTVDIKLVEILEAI